MGLTGFHSVLLHMSHTSAKVHHFFLNILIKPISNIGITLIKKDRTLQTRNNYNCIDLCVYHFFRLIFCSDLRRKYTRQWFPCFININFFPTAIFIERSFVWCCWCFYYCQVKIRRGMFNHWRSSASWHEQIMRNTINKYTRISF